MSITCRPMKMRIVVSVSPWISHVSPRRLLAEATAFTFGIFEPP